MIKELRFKAIQEELFFKGTVSIEELTKKTGSSRSTIVRDLEEMEKLQLLKRTWGGATDISGTIRAGSELPFESRSILNIEEKQRIGAAALSLIATGDSIFLSRGTTTLALAAKLSEKSNLQVSTDDLKIAEALSFVPEVYTLILGGSVHPYTYSTTGIFAAEMLDRIHVDKAFLGMDAVDFEMGFMDYTDVEIELKNKVIARADKSIMLCDHTKFNTKAFVNVCSFEDIDVLITGKEADKDVVKQLRKKGIEVILA